jgi:putative tricarboxylic transport membrane protein
VRLADQIAGAGLLLLGVAFSGMALWKYTYWGPTGPGSGFLPFWLGLTMAVLAAGLLLRARRARESGARWLPEGAGLRRLVAVLGVTTGLVVLLKVIGMAVGTVLFLVAILRLVEGIAWRSTLAIAIGAAVFNYLVFTYWLRVPFPVGVLGF